MQRRILSLILSLIMLIGLVPVAAFAGDAAPAKEARTEAAPAIPSAAPQTPTVTPKATPTAKAAATPAATPTVTPTAAPTATTTATPTATPVVSPEVSPALPTESPLPSPAATPTASPCVSPSPSPAADAPSDEEGESEANTDDDTSAEGEDAADEGDPDAAQSRGKARAPMRAAARAANYFKLSFNANGGTGSMPTDLRVDFGADITLPKCAFTKEGYDFDYWSCTHTGAKYADGSVFNHDGCWDDWWEDYDDYSGMTITLKAEWKPDVYTAAFDGIAAAIGTGKVAAEGALSLPQSDDSRTIEYKSSEPDYLSDAGVVLALPEGDRVTVMLTAEVTADKGMQTRVFTLTLYSEEAMADEALLENAVSAMPAQLKPVYGTDCNAAEYIKAKLGADYAGVNVSVTEAVTSADWGIAADGAISYYYNDSMRSQNNGTGYVSLTLEYKGMTREKELYAIIPWDEARAKARLEAELARISVPAEISEKTSITLPYYPVKEGVTNPNYYSYSDFNSWATVTWASNNKAIGNIARKTYPTYSPYTADAVPQKDDVDVTLTATLTWGKLTLTKPYTVKVKGCGVDPDQAERDELMAKLEAGLANPGLKDNKTKEKLDPAKVVNSIKLPTTGNFKIDGKIYKISLKSSNEAYVKSTDNNAALAAVTQPKHGEAAVTVTLTISLTKKADPTIYASKDIVVTVQPVAIDELDRELALMEYVKAHYFDAIKNNNTSPDNITGDLRPFQEAHYDAEGNVVWAYTHSEVTGSGIVPAALDGWYEGGEQWRLFRSDTPEVISHENLLVTPAKNTTRVTIRSALSSARYQSLAEKYPGDATLSKLINQAVSVTLTVPGTAPDSGSGAETSTSISAAVGVYDNTSQWIFSVVKDVPKGTSVFELVTSVLRSSGYSYTNYGGYISAVGGLAERDRGENSGWLYTVNGTQPDMYMNQVYVKNGDIIALYYTDDYTKPLGAAKADEDDEAEDDSEYSKIDEKTGEDIYITTGTYILGERPQGSIGDEWYILGLARAGRDIPAGYYEAAVAYVAGCITPEGRLGSGRATDSARLILTLSALGKDAADIGGHDILRALGDMDYIEAQGLSGVIYALLALDCRDYAVPQAPAGARQTSREALVQYLLDAQLSDGGWAFSGGAAEADMTAMALQTLARYYVDAPASTLERQVRRAVDRAIDTLSALQSDSGAYKSGGVANCESAAQVIVALTALGIDPAQDARFTKGGISVVDFMCAFYVSGGGFRHRADGALDPIATAQGYYALAAYYRFVSGESSLYDMRAPQALPSAA